MSEIDIRQLRYFLAVADATSDPKAAFSFYSHVFGWENAGEHQMGPEMVYYMFGRNGMPLGGMWKSDTPPSWLGYVRVKDVQQTAKKVTSAGGRVINGPMEVPGGDWIVQFTDPSGAMFAAHTLAADLKRVDYVDLRYTNGFAVGWRQGPPEHLAAVAALHSGG